MMTYVRLIETTGYIQESDAPQPPRSTGKWADVWDRFPAKSDAGVRAIREQGNLPPAEPKPQPHLRDEASQEGAL